MAPKNIHFQAFYLLHTLIRLFSFNYSSEAGGRQIESPSLLLLLLLIDQRQHFTNLAFHFTFIYCGSRSTRSFASLVRGGLSSSGTRVCHDRRHNSPNFMSASQFLHRALSSRDGIDVIQPANSSLRTKPPAGGSKLTATCLLCIYFRIN